MKPTNPNKGKEHISFFMEKDDLDYLEATLEAGKKTITKLELIQLGEILVRAWKTTK